MPSSSGILPCLHGGGHSSWAQLGIRHEDGIGRVRTLGFETNHRDIRGALPDGKE